MKIGLIGAGKVGCSFGSYLVSRGISISGYLSRTFESARQAAEQTSSKAYRSPEDLAADSDVIFVTTPDGAVSDVFKELAALNTDGVVLAHMSGALTSEVYPGKCASLHPLLAVSSKNDHAAFADCVFTLECAPDYFGAPVLRSLMERCKNTVVEIAPEAKVRYHAAAVMASNLVTGLYFEALNELQVIGFDEKSAQAALGTLFAKNAQAAAEKGPVDALTGPIERNDTETVAGHLTALSGHAKEVYTVLSESVAELAERKNPERDYEALRKLLEAE